MSIFTIAVRSEDKICPKFPVPDFPPASKIVPSELKATELTSASKFVKAVPVLVSVLSAFMVKK